MKSYVHSSLGSSIMETNCILSQVRAEPKSDEVATFGKILGKFSPIVPPSAAGVRSRRFRREGHLVAGVGTF